MGEEVLAGMIVTDKVIRNQGDQTFLDKSALARILELVQNASERKAPAELFIRKFARVYTPIVIGLAVLIVLLPFIYSLITPQFLFTFNDWLYRALVFLVISCPCALVVSIPLGYFGGIGAASRLGILFKGGNYLDAITRVNTVVFDKTGTLTQNKMTVVDHYGKDEELLACAMSLCSDAQVSDDGVKGEPTEVALVEYGEKFFHKNDKLKEMPRIKEAPFDSMRKMMTTIHEQRNHTYIQFSKGAPDVLLSRCDYYIENNMVKPLDDIKRQEIMAQNKAFADQALRVLAAGYQIYDTKEALKDNVLDMEQHLIFIGLCGMIDPIREEVKGAISECKQAGIRPVMITGDHIDTAVAIAKQLGILKDKSQAITGAQLDEMSDEEFKEKIAQYCVYARVQPEHKVRIVDAWKAQGKVVSMSGDGVNDAPSIKRADIGVGMGITGTDVTKNVADMVLADDNFATIIVAVEEGRKVFSNIQKSIQYLLSANMAEVFIIFFATLFGWDVLQPVHLLWINLVTDTLPAIALGVEPAEPGIMTHKPRGRQSNFFDGGVFGAIMYQGVFQTILVLAVYGWGLVFPEHHTQAEIHADALTMAYATLGLIQLLHAFNVKSVYQSVFKVGLFRNKTFNWAIPVAFILLMATIVVPGFNNLFHVSHLSFTQWLAVIVGSFLIVVLVEIVKAIQRALGKDKDAI